MSRRHVRALALVTMLLCCGAAACHGTPDTTSPVPPATAAIERTEAPEAPAPAPATPPPGSLRTHHSPGVAPDLQRLAGRFVAYAVGDAATLPHAGSVELSIGGSPAARLDLDAASTDRDAWRVCPDGWQGYGAAACPVDLLGPLRAAQVNGTTLVTEPGLTDVTCAPTRRGPASSGRVVVLRPAPGQRDCVRDFALALVADERGRLVAVDLTLAEP